MSIPIQQRMLATRLENRAAFVCFVSSASFEPFRIIRYITVDEESRCASCRME